MNERTGAEGQLSVDRAVTDRVTGERPGGGLWKDVKRGDNSGLQRMGGDKPEHQHTLTAEPMKPMTDCDKIGLIKRTQYLYGTVT